LFYGNSPHPVEIKLEGNDEILHIDTLPPSEKTAVFRYTLPRNRRELTLQFAGKESPEIYGVSLEGSSGVMVSNVSMRGQAGTHFWGQPAQQMRAMLGASDVRMIILQYGANAVPYADTQERIDEYCVRFGKNIEYLKRIAPDAEVLVIGPADMAMKQGTAWVTYPNLEQMRDAMKAAVLAAGAAYWDPYAAMGGAGTIQQWVLSEPPLAVVDHVHFTLDGAEIIAHWFYDAMIKDYEEYLSRNCDEIENQ
jgi:hypothetical protein